MLKDIFGNEDIKDNLKVLKSNLPELLLFSGPKGVGKKHIALNLIDEIYNGSFSSRLEDHPDILILEPDTKIFKLELIAEMKDFIGDTAFELDKKFIIMKNVDLMNKESANACLKNFEEAPNNTHFILLAENKELVIDTILSRSTSIAIPPLRDLRKYIPDLTDLEVKLMGGCLGQRVSLSEAGVNKIHSEVIELLESYLDLDYSKIIDWFLGHKDTDIALLNNIFIIASQDLVKKNKNLNTSLLFLKSCKEFKDKIPLNLRLDMHFKNMLVQNKNTLSSLVFKKPKDKEEENYSIIDQINTNDNPEIDSISFDSKISPYLDNFVKISFTDEELVPLGKFVDKIVEAKLKEDHYKVDSGSLKKRFYTGFLGEMAISLIFEKNTVDWAIGNSKIFNKADLSAIGKNIGIKTVEWGKFPIIHKNPKRPEIINIREGNSVYVCGIATIANMESNSSDDLILSDQLRKRNVKTGFFGFEDLKYFPKDRILQRLKNREQ